MADISGAVHRNGEQVFRIIITCMFTVILGLVGYIMGEINSSLDMVSERVDRSNDRVTDLNNRVIRLEVQAATR